MNQINSQEKKEAEKSKIKKKEKYDSSLPLPLQLRLVSSGKLQLQQHCYRSPLSGSFQCNIHISVSISQKQTLQSTRTVLPAWVV